MQSRLKKERLPDYKYVRSINVIGECDETLIQELVEKASAATFMFSAVCFGIVYVDPGCMGAEM
jgi:hypothetical protein